MELHCIGMASLSWVRNTLFFFLLSYMRHKYQVCMCADQISLFFGEGATDACFLISVRSKRYQYLVPVVVRFFVGIGARKEQELSIPSYCSERLFPSQPTSQLLVL